MSTIYNVILSLSTQGSLTASLGSVGAKASEADAKIHGLRGSAERVGESIASMGERVGGFIEGIADHAIEAAAGLAKIGAAAVVGVAAYGVGKLNNELEQTQISLGAIAQAQGFTKTFEQGLALAGDELKKMKQDVKTLPGDLGQLSDIMKMIATPAARGGASMDSIRLLAGKTMLTSTILGVQQDVAAREMAGLLAGRAGSHNILGGRMGLLGEEAKEFNAMSPEKRLARINVELAKYDGAANRFGQSFIANFTTLKDNLKYSLIAEATGPLFDRVKNAMAEINTYFDTHQEKVKEIANTISSRLVEAWDAVENKFKKIEPIIARIADHILHMQPGEIGKKLEHAGEIVIGTKIAGAGISATASAVPSIIRVMAPLFAGGGAAAAAGGTAGVGEAAAGIGSIIAIAPEAAVALGGVGAALTVLGGGVLDNLVSKTNEYHDADVKLVEQLGKHVGEIGESLKPAGAEARELADTAGHYGLVALDAGARLFNQNVKDYAAMAGALGDELSLAKADIKTFGQYLLDGGQTIEFAMNKFRNSIDTPAPLPDRDTVPLFLKSITTHISEETAKKGAGGGGGGTHIQKIEIKIEGNDDPSRVARLTMRELEKMTRNPTSSRYVPNYASASHR